MFKKISKFVALVCVTGILLSCTVFAEDTNDIPVETVYCEDVTKVPFETNIYSSRFFNGAGAYNYYYTLTDFQKYLYDCLVGIEPTMPTEEEGIYQKTVVEVTGVPIDDYNKYFDINQVALAVRALMMDFPEYVWLTNGCCCGTTDGYLHWDSATDTHFFDYYIGITRAENYSNPIATKATLDEGIASFDVPIGSRYDMLLNIHDKISNMVTYSPCVISNDHSPNESCPTCMYAYQAVGAFLKYGTQTKSYIVCQGYSELFKLICDKYSIPCTLVISTNHMWNVVRMEDGNWYGIDVTWDDQESRIYYDYFLSGGNTLASPGFGGESFNASHPVSQNYPPPTLSDTKYAFPAGMYTAPTDELDYVNNILTAYSVHKIRYNGLEREMTPTADGTGTGSTFTAGTGSAGASQTWRLIVIGDITGDGLARSDDLAQIMMNVVGANTRITAESIYEKAADITGNGVIDGVDCMLSELTASGHLTLGV